VGSQQSAISDDNDVIMPSSVAHIHTSCTSW